MDRFTGFTLPDGAWLPPELIYLLPHISGSELKAVIVILYHNLQVGGGEPASLTDIENYTGLSRRQVIRSLSSLLESGMIERQAVGQSYIYLPSLKSSDILSPPTDKMSLVQLRESDSELIKDSLTDSLNSLNLTGDKMSLVRKLRAAGVYLKTAQGIVDLHQVEEVERYLGFYRHALLHNLAQGPGWLVQALKEGWGEPLGYKKNGIACGCTKCVGNLERSEERYADWDSE